MSKYTTELRFICETLAGKTESEGYNNVDNIISVSRGGVFSFQYPIFDESYRPALETKIIRHYYTREICAETVGLWKLWLESRMNEIMPYYNQLYKSALLEFNPFYDTDYTREGEREGNKDGKTTGKLTEGSLTSRESQDSGQDKTNIKDTPKNDTWDYYSDTPQGGVGDLASLEYLTNARHITTDGAGSNRDDILTYGKKNVTDSGTQREQNTQGTDIVTSTDEYIERVKGKMGSVSYSKMLQEFRETFINIDWMIIKDLRPLFFNLW